MALFGWFKGRGNDTEKRLTVWREAWNRAVDAEDASQLPALQAELSVLATQAEDVEIEAEMLEGLERLSRLLDGSGGATLPTIETHHRIVGTDDCHFSAPASLPDDPSQPSGRVLLTHARCLFLGGARGSTVAWHAVREVVRAERDVLLGRADGSAAAHFRFNSFADAVTATFIARRLKGTRAPARGL